MKPPLKFGTVPFTYTENAIRKYFPEMHNYMRKYNKLSLEEGILAVKKG